MARYQPHDRFYRKAREKGLPSRAAFKIEELLERVRMPAGARVVDLGCAPGGWLAILSAAVGENGRVIGIDLAACANFGAVSETVVADIRAAGLPALVTEKLGRPADLVTSDLSPRLSGIRERDEAKFLELMDAALVLASHTLRPGGAMIAKLFMGGAFKAVVARFEQFFAKVEVTRVKATRPGSSELYLIARDFRA